LHKKVRALLEFIKDDFAKNNCIQFTPEEFETKLVMQYGMNYQQQVKPKMDFLRNIGILTSKANMTSTLLVLNIQRLMELLGENVDEESKTQGD